MQLILIYVALIINLSANHNHVLGLHVQVCSMPACTESRRPSDLPSFPYCEHLSGNYHGPCLGTGEGGCDRTCKAESPDNFGGACEHYQCWCYSTNCPSEIVAGASAPIQP